MDKKDQDRLLEIILKRGKIGNDLFNYDSAEQKRFITSYGLKDAMDRYFQAEFNYNHRITLRKQKTVRPR